MSICLKGAGSVVAVIEGGGGGGGATYVFYTESGGNTVNRLDAADGANGAVIATITSGNLRGITIDRDNDKIYVAALGLDKIVQMDLDGANATDWKTGLNDPFGVRYFNGRIYWTELNGDLVKSDVPATGSETTHIDAADGITDPTYLFVTASYIYLSEGTATGSGLTGRWDHDGTDELNYKDHEAFNGIGVFADEANGYVYYNNGNGGTGTREPVATGTEEGAVAVTGTLYGMTFDPANGHIYAVGFNATAGAIIKYDIAAMPTITPADALWETTGITNARDVDYY